MRKEPAPDIKPVRLEERNDSAADLRIFASWLGLVIVTFGVVVCGYLFIRIGETLLDPRAFETQVDRWEFVVRGRTTDAFPDSYETPEGTLNRDDTTEAATEGPAAPSSPSQPNKDRVEEMVEFIGRVGSKSSRPAALLLIILVLSLLVRIAIGVVHAGIRLAYISAGEKDYMKRVIDELVEQRKNPDA